MKAENEKKKTKILAVYESNGDWRSKAQQIGVPQTAAYWLVSQDAKKA